MKPITANYVKQKAELFRAEDMEGVEKRIFGEICRVLGDDIRLFIREIVCIKCEF